MSRGKVLVVDDDPIVLEVARERLEKAGYDVEVRDEALGTSKFILQYKPDFVLLDVMMPGLSGDRLAELLKKQSLTSHVAIILHSSKESSDLQDLVRRTECLGAIEKTGDDGKFRTEFERLAQRHRARPEPAGTR